MEETFAGQWTVRVDCLSVSPQVCNTLSFERASTAVLESTLLQLVKKTQFTMICILRDGRHFCVFKGFLRNGRNDLCPLCLKKAYR